MSMSPHPSCTITHRSDPQVNQERRRLHTAMQALSGARTALRRAAQSPRMTNGGAFAKPQRRGLADEAEVPWADYRAGKVSLQEWVDGNRHKVAGGFFAFYVGLIGWNLRPKKNKDPAPVPEPAPVDS